MSTSVVHRMRWVLATVFFVALLTATVYEEVIHLQKSRKAAAEAAAKAEKKAAKAKDKRPAQPVVARSGVPTLKRKLAAKEPLTVAFIGGSITQNGSAGGFVSAVPAWLKAQSPGIAVRVINAGIAATGSDFGAQRVDRDVIVHHPDLVFVEFAVNDADRDCVVDMERLVRKIRLDAPQADIVLIYTITDLSVTLLEQGKFPPSVKQHETVAQHYGLPTVALGFTAMSKLQSGAWKWADFSPDYCHPTVAGYASYNADIEAALPQLLASTASALPPVPTSLIPNLVVHPPTIAPVAQPVSEPLRDAEGKAALATSELPQFGLHWVEKPEFTDATGATWRLLYRRNNPKGVADASAGLEKGDWALQRWFEEARSFTGSTSHTLEKADAATGNQFGANPVDSAVLTWRAPVAGRYLVQAAATSIEGGGNAAEGFAGLNVVHFGGAAARGESVALQTPAQETAKLDLSCTVTLAAGDELAFVFLDHDFKYAFFHGFRVTVGRFESAAP